MTTEAVPVESVEAVRPWWLSRGALMVWWVLAGVVLGFAVGVPPVQRTQEARVLETAREMLEACEAALPADIAVCVAAVADWRPQTQGTRKIKKGAEGPAPIALVENPDILAALSGSARRPRLVVGFAAETNDVEAHARAKLDKKGCDWIIANDVSLPGVMGGDDNTVAIVSRKGVERWDRLSKGAVARKLAERIAEELS